MKYYGKIEEVEIADGRSAFYYYDRNDKDLFYQYKYSDESSDFGISNLDNDFYRKTDEKTFLLLKQRFMERKEFSPE